MYEISSSDGEVRESLLLQATSWSAPTIRKIETSLRPDSAQAQFAQFLAFMTPSFLAKNDTQSEKINTRRDSPTEFLDGLRGVASLVVFSSHWIGKSFPSMTTGWGYQGNYSIWLLPYIRLIFSGTAAVSIFYVISGFVLSHRFIQLIHRNEHDKILSRLSSITFRRAFRLFAPSFLASFLVYIATSFGLIPLRKVSMAGVPFTHGPGAFIAFLRFESDPWVWERDGYGFYNPQLWTIAAEFRGSLLVFIMIAGLARSRLFIRIFVECCVTMHAFYHRRWDMALFVAGMFIAELEVKLKTKSASPRWTWSTILLTLGILAGGFLLGYPRDGWEVTPIFSSFQEIWPYDSYCRRFWIAIGAILVVGTMTFMPLFQALFLTRPIRYLGNISFSLYLVHHLGNQTIGWWLLYSFRGLFGRDELLPYAASFVVASVIYFPIIMWMADVFWRAADIPTNRFAKTLEQWCLIDGIAM